MKTAQKLALSEAYWFQEGPGVRNWQFTQNGIKLLNVANITTEGRLDLSKTDRCLDEKEVKQKYSHFLVEAGDLVIASSGISFDSDGLLRTRSAYVMPSHLPLCMNTSTIRFKAKEGLSTLQFLHFWLDSEEFRQQITRLVTGSAQQNFGPSHLSNLVISLPPLAEQQRLAALLEKADRLRQSRRYAQTLSDAFLQSVFLQMFGDERTFSMTLLGDALDESPKNGLYLPGDRYGSGTPIIRIDNFYGGVLNSPIHFKRARATAKEISDFNIQNDDVLVNRVNSLEYLGKCAFVQGIEENTVYESNMMRLRVNRKMLHPLYLTTYLSSLSGIKQILLRAKKAVNQASINQGDVESLKIPVPPLEKQEEFARVVRRYERLRAQQAEATRQAEHLFQSLLAQTFAPGEESAA